MEFLILTLFLISALVMQYKPQKKNVAAGCTIFLISGLILYFKPQRKNLATGCAVVGCVILIALEFYVNLWVVVPVGNF